MFSIQTNRRRHFPLSYTIPILPHFDLHIPSRCEYSRGKIVLTTANNHRNVTTSLLSSPTTYSDYFQEIAQYNVHLNVFEKAWAAWYAYMQNDVLATGIMSFMMHEIVYFGRCLPWMIADKIPYFQKYKIQGVCSHSSISISLN
jgi:hypothetical protein